MEFGQSTFSDKLKASFRNSVRTPEFNMKHLKEAEGRISPNFENITMRIKTIVRILLVIKTANKILTFC